MTGTSKTCWDSLVYLLERMLLVTYLVGGEFSLRIFTKPFKPLILFTWGIYMSTPSFLLQGWLWARAHCSCNWFSHWCYSIFWEIWWSCWCLRCNWSHKCAEKVCNYLLMWICILAILSERCSTIILNLQFCIGIVALLWKIQALQTHCCKCKMLMIT